MKRIIIMLFILFFAHIYLHAGGLRAVFSYATFADNNGAPYIETYLLVNGNSVNFSKTDAGTFRATIEITMLFKQNDTVRTFKKYELLSPEISDTTATDFNFLDQQRFLLDNGNYDFELFIADKNSEHRPFFAADIIEVNYPQEELVISDMQLVESYTKTVTPNILTKAGFDLIPQLVNYYPQTIEKIVFYAEVYNSSKIFGSDGAYLISYFLEPWETQKPLQKFMRMKRETAKDINVVFGEFNIKELASGNYNLVIEVRDRENKLMTQRKAFFYRSNPGIEYNIDGIKDTDISFSFVAQITNEDTLKDFIQSLYPISTEIERVFATNALRRGDFSAMQKYFYNFWYTRDMFNPENAWQEYFKEVQKVNALYGTRIQRGYNTDRGRVYLQYGAPNSIAKSEFEPSAYPYEIWHYYNLGNQTNRRFVFYLREFATNNYELIHSDALGEINDPRWQVKVHKRDTPSHSLDPENAERHWGGRIDDYYRNPR